MQYRERIARAIIFYGRFEPFPQQHASARASIRRVLVAFGLWTMSALLPHSAQAGPAVLLQEDLSSSVYQGGIAVLTFTLTVGPETQTGLLWSDDLAPLGMQVVQCPGAIGASCSATVYSPGTMTGLTPSSTMIYQQIDALNGSCKFSVCVTATKIGTQVNTTSVVSTTSGTSGAAATASIDVLPDLPPTLSQQFSADTVAQFGTALLTLRISDPTNAPLYGIAVTDTLPAGLKVGQNSGVSCSMGVGDITPGGTFTAIPGSGSITVSNLQLSSQCSFTVEITGVELGLQTNTTSAITSTNGGTGESSTASITVIDQVFKDGFE